MPLEQRYLINEQISVERGIHCRSVEILMLKVLYLPLRNVFGSQSSHLLIFHIPILSWNKKHHK